MDESGKLVAEGRGDAQDSGPLMAWDGRGSLARGGVLKGQAPSCGSSQPPEEGGVDYSWRGGE